MEQLKGVSLSPISVVHLFRQYFFELDTFLGTSERHVWLSPGSSVELVEVHTRRTTIERTVETTLDILTKSESATTSQEELSEAVKDENSQDIKAGASVTASYATVQATASFDYAGSQKQARETTHKRNREQTDKLSSEIRKNFKTTFKSTTEVTDTSSTRHLLANNTSELINYELRRKMRQVGVQLQDIGTYLCWQTYVDDPGAALGLAKLIHIAKPAELDAIPHPEELPALQPFQESKLVTIPFISIDGTDADNEGEIYVNGIESDNSEFLGSEERIQHRFRQEFVCPRVDYELADVSFDAQGKPVSVSRADGIDNSALPRASFTLNLDSADFQGQNSLQVQLILHWSPLTSANQEIEAKNKALQAQFSAAEKQAFEKAAVETLKERVDVISKIKARNGEDLREEERIVIYRKLVQEMLQKNIEMPDDQTRHVVAELINSIFDVDKMLYFVSPEWWRPRLRRSAQQLKALPEGGAPPVITGTRTAGMALHHGLLTAALSATTNSAPTLAHSSTVGWGGVDDASRDNYYITADSEPARMGSSLGWLLQLDGDSMRNAFLNAPWVKAVMPIRPGKEKAAINWLKGVEGMNGITDDVIYHASGPHEVDINGDPLEGQPLIDVLYDLAAKIRRKHEDGIKMGQFPKASEVIDPVLADPGNTVTATPVDRVYEHGFFPLEGSFRANVGDNYEIFDQWTEVLPDRPDRPGRGGVRPEDRPPDLKITFALKGFGRNPAASAAQVKHFLLSDARVEVTLVFEDSTEKVLVAARGAGWPLRPRHPAHGCPGIGGRHVPAAQEAHQRAVARLHRAGHPQVPHVPDAADPPGLHADPAADQQRPEHRLRPGPAVVAAQCLLVDQPPHQRRSCRRPSPARSGQARPEPGADERPGAGSDGAVVRPPREEHHLPGVRGPR